MRLPTLKLMALLAVPVLCGCQSLPPTTPTLERSAPAKAGKNSFDPATRRNAIALLADLLGEEKHVSKLLLIKLESRELNRLIKDISEASARGAKQLEALQKQEPSLAQAKTDLPPGEQATREAIAKTKQHLLLHGHGAEFEFQLLLTQTEALGYGAHLALVVAQNEPQPERAQEFSRLSLQLTQLHEQVLVMLRKAH